MVCLNILPVEDHKCLAKNRSAMRTWGLMLNFIPFGWNASCSQISGSGSCLATSEKVHKSLQFLKTERKYLAQFVVLEE